MPAADPVRCCFRMMEQTSRTGRVDVPASAPAAPKVADLPPIPHTIEQLDVPKSLMIDIALRRLSTEGTSTITSLSRVLKLSIAAMKDIFDYLRQQHLIDVKGMIGEDYSFALTAAGRQLALDRFQVCQYAGAVPVSLAGYHRVVRAQAAKVKVNRGALRSALSDLVLSDSLLAQLGPALISQRSLFLYGPSGKNRARRSGKPTLMYPGPSGFG